jgi:hypothetical protein
MNQRQRARLRLNRQSSLHQTNGEQAAANPAQLTDLRIGQLLVEGLQAADRHVFGDSLQTELTRLLAERAEPLRLGQSAAVEKLSLGTVSPTGGAGAANIGRQVAETVYRGLRQLNIGNGSSLGLTTSNKRGGSSS